MSEEIILEARDIWHSYEENDRFSLQGLDLKVKKGSKVAFMGANGSGKSTFFLCCNGILRPQKGDILFHGKPVSYKRKELLALRAKVGIVFQDPDKQLFSASVEQEISFGILNLGVAKEQARTEVEQVIPADAGGAHRPPCSGKVRLTIHSPKVVLIIMIITTLLF